MHLKLEKSWTLGFPRKFELFAIVGIFQKSDNRSFFQVDMQGPKVTWDALGKIWDSHFSRLFRSLGAVSFLHKLRIVNLDTPQKINMEPENTPLEEENHLPNHHFQVLC